MTDRPKRSVVQQDKKVAATAAAAAEVKKVTVAAQQKQCVAAFEDQLGREDQQREKHMAHPDLVPAHHATTEDALKLEQDPRKSLESEDGSSDEEEEWLVSEPELEFSNVRPAEHEYTSSKGPADIPDKSVVETESSDGQGLGLEDEFDGNHDNDDDYVMHSDDADKESQSTGNSDRESDYEVCEATKKPSKNTEKPKQGNFCKAINHVCNNSAVAGTTAMSFLAKMKLPTAQKQKEPENKPKCAKKEEGGLLAGWSDKLAKQRLETISAQNASTHEAVEDPDDPLEYTGGEFDEDEALEAVRAACDMKKPAVTVQGNRTTTVKILEPVPVERSSSSRHVKKVKYTLSSLPFPYLFGTNTVMEDIITEVWRTVFPSIANEVVGSSHEAIVHVAGDALTDWRSSMGKEGLCLVLQALNEAGVMQEDAPCAAEYYLENYRFIYQNPDDNKGNKGAFLNPLVTACLTAHLKKTLNNVIQYGYPVGALAIATAVLECGLELIKAGHIGLDGCDTLNWYTGYTDAVWGGKTRGWAVSTAHLDDTKWRVILHAAVDKMDWNADDGDIEEGTGSGGTFDPRSLIEIW
ncbi:hypothetical protein BYT27DRAFT_7286661 [Phlegmacium glaucopus]|nr:hypothetical protein BYT27DRAFT_7286661 [Phlegmacium glaucopus]